MLASWGTWWGGDATQPDPTRWKRVEITNMPAYEEGVATTEVYGRVINLAFGLESVDYKIVIGNDRNDPSKGVAVPVHFENIGETKIFKFEIPRTSNDETFYVFVVKENVEDTSLIGYGFVMHLTYNNVFGYEEE